MILRPPWRSLSACGWKRFRDHRHLAPSGLIAVVLAQVRSHQDRPRHSARTRSACSSPLVLLFARLSAGHRTSEMRPACRPKNEAAMSSGNLRRLGCFRRAQDRRPLPKPRSVHASWAGLRPTRRIRCTASTGPSAAPSRLGRLSCSWALIGACLALLFEGMGDPRGLSPWVTGRKGSLLVGKPLYPVMFEVTVLFATFTRVWPCCSRFNKLPFFAPPGFATARPSRASPATSSRSASKPAAAFDAEAARQALIDNGAESSGDRAGSRRGSPRSAWSGFYAPSRAIVAACVVAGAGLFAAEKLIPIVPTR